MSWNHIRNREPLIQFFRRAVDQNRLAHAYLFVGPEGVGKKLFAFELAKALLCEERETGSAKLDACDACLSCRMIDAGTHPDFFAVARPEESNEMPIELMRELCQKFSLKSARGRGKIAVLDDADDLNAASANCFLKTLEEPPPQSVFFLIGTSRDRQLPTIQSRSQVVRFAPLPDESVAEFLQARGIIDPNLISRVLPLAGGSLGQALALADVELWKFRGQLLDELSKHQIDPVSTSKLWMSFVENAGKEMALQRRQAERVLRILVAFLGDALVQSLGDDAKRNDAHDSKRLQGFVANRTPEQIMELVDRCLEAELQIRRYVQLVLVVEGLVDAFSNLSQ